MILRSHFRARLARLALGAAVFAAPLAALAEKPAPATPPMADKTPPAQQIAAQPLPAQKIAGPAWANKVKAKALSAQVTQGLDWLVAHQGRDGGWGQGEESVNMGGAGALAQTSNVADTVMATLALLRSGSTTAKGPHAKSLARAVNFVLSQVEASDPGDMYVTPVRGTRVQGKIGPYVDTFLAAQLLGELDGHMPDAASNARVRAALDRVLAKMDKGQDESGGYAGGSAGWAPVLSTAIAAKSVNQATRKGAKVSKRARVRSENWAKSKFNADQGSFDMDGSAGVGLYAAAASVGAMADAVATNAQEEAEVQARAKGGDQVAIDDLSRMQDTKKTQEAAQANLLVKMDQPAFAAGFGSNGGEEFLSYMLMGESLAAQGGEVFAKWDAQMTGNLNRVQNKDGSWTGHHCITGRTFCTAAALLVLMTDRAANPLANQIKRG